MDSGSGRLRRFALPRLLAWAAMALCLRPMGFAQTAAARGDANTDDARIAALLTTLGKARMPDFAVISPDGTYVAWAMSSPEGPELHLTRIAEAGAKSGERERVISPDTVHDAKNDAAGACTGSHPAWSPDGSQLAFLSNCAGDDKGWEVTTQNSIFVWTPASNAVKQLSKLTGELSSLKWSPDGKTIGFLYVENATRRPGALDATKPWSGVIGEDGVEVQRVYAIQVSDSKGVWLTPEKLHVYEFTWAPSGEEIAYIAAVPPGESNWWVAKLYTELVRMPDRQPSNPEAPRGVEKIARVVIDPQITPGPMHGMQIALPQFSPDGTRIAFIGGLMSDQGSTGGDVYVIPASGVTAGGEPRDVTPNRQSSPAWIHWLDDNTIGICEHAGGSTHITALDLRTGKDVPSIDLTLPETIFADDDVMSVSTSNTDNIAMVRQSFERGPEVWAGPLDSMKQLTHLNDAVKPAWGKAESIDYTDEGLHIQGWLLYPAG